MHTFRRARFLKSSRYIPLRSQEGPLPRCKPLQSSRCIPSEELPGGSRARGAYLGFSQEDLKLEVHTSSSQTDPGGPRARGVYLQKSSLPGESEVHTSTLPGGSRGANLYKSLPSEELPRMEELEVHTSTLKFHTSCIPPEELEVHTSMLPRIGQKDIIKKVADGRRDVQTTAIRGMYVYSYFKTGTESRCIPLRRTESRYTSDSTVALI